VAITIDKMKGLGSKHKNTKMRKGARADESFSGAVHNSGFVIVSSTSSEAKLF
jgi:hypothetical protein